MSTADMKSSVALATIGHAVWAKAVGRRWRIKDVSFATIKMGGQMARDRPLHRAEPIMGHLIAVGLVRVGLRKDMTVGDLLQHMQDELVSTIQHEHEGSSAMIEHLGPGMIDWHPLRSDTASQILARTQNPKL